MPRLPLLEDLGDVSGKRVLVRTDFNVPMEGPDNARVITDDFRKNWMKKSYVKKILYW